MYKYIAQQLAQVKDDIAAAACSYGRSPEDVRLVAVSKTFPSEAIESAYGCGQRVFGENKVLELEEKNRKLPPDIQWHLIGHIQSNKALKAVQNAQWIHSVDSLKLLRRLERLAAGENRQLKILLQFNVSGEASKQGLAPDSADARILAEAASGCKHLDFRGLMTMAPFGESEDNLRRIFASLRELRDTLEVHCGRKLPELSTGMSGDFVPAIAEGATFVRIGSAIFGNRIKK